MTALLFSILISISGNSLHDLRIKETGMTAEDSEVFKVADSLARQMPFTQANVEAALGTTLTLIQSDQHLTHLVSGPVTLPDGATAEASLALGPNFQFNEYSGLSLTVSDKCISLRAVREHYGRLALIGLPRGHSRLESIVYATRTKWASLSFSFLEEKPDCLASIGIRPHKEGDMPAL